MFLYFTLSDCAGQRLYLQLHALLFVRSVSENIEVLNNNFLSMIKHARKTMYVGQLHWQCSLDSH